MTLELRQAARLLARDRAFTAVAVLVLSLGIGANTGVFSIVNALLLRPLVGNDVAGLVGIYSREGEAGSYQAFSYPEFAALRGESDLFSSVMAQTFALIGLREGDATRRVWGGVVSSDYFSTLGVRPAVGRFFEAAEEAPDSEIPVAVVSYAFWRKHGLDPSFLGRSIRLNERDVTVVGVAPEGFSGTMALIAPELWLPLGMYRVTANDFMGGAADRGLADPAHRTLILAGRLRPGLAPATADAGLALAAQHLDRAHPLGEVDRVLSVAPMSRLGLSTAPMPQGPLSLASALLMAMSGLVLLIACLNIANMLMARGESRRKEIAIRVALGARPGRIVGQLVGEGLLLSLLGGAGGLLLSWWTMRLLVASIPTSGPLGAMSIAFPSAPDVRVVGATFAFCLVSTLLFALLPARRLARADALPELKEQAGETRGGRRLGLLAPRNLLAVGQVALSLALLTTGGLFIRGARAAADADPGFRMERGLLIEIDPSLAGRDETAGREAYRRVLERVRRLPGVEAASLASSVPFGAFSFGRRVQRAGEPPAAPGQEPVGVRTQHVIVGADYARSLGLPVLRGRDFRPAEESDRTEAPPVLVDEPLARQLWPGAEPVGQMLQLAAGSNDPAEGPFEVIGVIPGLRHDLFDPAPVPHVYLPFGSRYQSQMTLHVRAAGGGDAALLQAVRRELREADPTLPVLGAFTLSRYRDESLPVWLVRSGARLFTGFGLAALFLAVVGVYALKAWLVARRTREIGIRMALGASPGDVLREVLGEGLRLAGAGLGLGLLLALGCGRLVSSLLYQVSPSDPAVFGLAPLLLASAGLVAIWIPARRATRVAPVVALRSE